MTCPINRDRMIDKVFEMVQNADDATLEQFYWFMVMEMES